MKSYVTGLTALLLSFALVGCNGHGDTGTGDSSTTGDSGTVAKTITLHYEFDLPTGPDSCFVNVDGVFAGKTDTDIKVTAGPHTITFGDLNNTTDEGTNSLPIHTGSVEGEWVYPPIVQDFESDVDEAKDANRYVHGKWTFEVPDDAGNHTKPMVLEIKETGGDTLTGYYFENVTVTVEKLSYSADGVTQTGSFTSPTTLHLDSTGGMYDYTVDACEGASCTPPKD